MPPRASSGACASKKRHWGQRALMVVGVLLILAVAAFWRGSIRTYTVASASMEPTLHCAAAPGCERLQADQLIVETIDAPFRSLRRGDIVVLRSKRIKACDDNGLIVKRVVAVGGETVTYRQGRLSIDGVVRREPYLRSHEGAGRPVISPREVPPGQFFVMGDNRARSCDSRAFGPVRRSEIVGRVVLVYSPDLRLP